MVRYKQRERKIDMKRKIEKPLDKHDTLDKIVTIIKIAEDTKGYVTEELTNEINKCILKMKF